ncbi:DEAD/DEAH box helicase family protein [Metamycoplasma equirhinis]|uniref:DEAD/DEAH box helicase family protein n=1 Tax=Metamycoplasma equirhinis TaxID=92402 RepID=UPI003593319B
MKLSNCQESTVNELVSKFNPNKKTIIDFQAPTGSGKTFMIANMIDKLISKYPNEKLTFVIATLSSASLPKQMLDNLLDYKKYLSNHFITIERKESPSTNKIQVKDAHYQILAKQNNILILGTQSFGKGRIFSEEGTINAFLSQIKTENYKLVYIRDEAHYGGEAKKENNNFQDFSLDKDFNIQMTKIKKEEQKFEFLIQSSAHFIIKMTATPKGKNELVLLEEKDLEEDNITLLKKFSKYNENINSIKDDEISNEQILEIACEKFKEIKFKYADIEKEPYLQNINPAMLIQVKDKYENKQEEFKKEIENIISILNKNGLTWVKYFGSNDIDSSIRLKDYSLRTISHNSSDIDVIIFKIGPATGWNIPRACMLVQLRNVSSESLNIQTLGRIKRNPNPDADFSINSIGFNYYYYSNIAESKKQRVTLVLKEKFCAEEFKTGFIDKKEIKSRIRNQKYLDDLISLLDVNELNAEYEKYKNYYKNHDYIIANEESFGNKKLIIEEIKNNIELEIYKENFLFENRTYFTKEIIINIENWFLNYKKLNQFSDDFSINLFWFIISITKIEEIKDKFISVVDNSENKGKIYKISTKKLPINNDFLINDKSIEKNIADIKYAYENLRSKKENSNINYFDSKPEVKFIELFKDYILNENNKYEIKIWTKNPIHHGIYLEYFNDENNIAKSYPDFIIKIMTKSENRLEHSFYIEVKHEEDKSIKVKNIIKGYEKYFINENISLLEETNNRNLTFMLAKVSANKPNSINFQGFSSNARIQNLLTENEKNKKPISFLRELFDVLN